MVRAFRHSKGWRGALLAVEVDHGQQSGGGVAYRARFASLPADLQARLNDLQRPIEGPSTPRDAVSAEANRRLNIIAPIIAHPAGSAERRKAHAAVMAATHFDNGVPVLLADTTVRRWVKLHDLMASPA
jgi:hypothetical protein